jgi:hypothetical protein
VQEARHYGYSQIHIEIARQKLNFVAYEVASSFDNRAPEKHRTQPNKIRIISPHQCFDTPTAQFVTKRKLGERPSQLGEKVRAQSTTKGRGGDARVQARQTQVRKKRTEGEEPQAGNRDRAE